MNGLVSPAGLKDTHLTAPRPFNSVPDNKRQQARRFMVPEGLIENRPTVGRAPACKGLQVILVSTDNVSFQRWLLFVIRLKGNAALGRVPDSALS